MTDQPCHLHEDGNDHTCCGIPMKSPKALPYVSVHHANRHVEGYGLVLCEECRRKAFP